MEAIEMLKPSTEHLEEHYAEHKGKPFFPKLIDYMQSGPVVGMVWSGKNVIAETRKFLGATNPINANPGTIRGDFAVDSSKNICHASDSPASAEREIKLWFPRGYIEWTRQTDRVMY
ncbi:Nucleoside diphosphate kinase [Zancudomyces culisetae]|uniref:Nucleoside diphosphate kinase n=1 Tax=Zancudomyces culisetae TaxID=1213189 RepID=A0A1R1PWP3_ZANCU|nr:Nucleoside diphosphate kinase [Zancudomyces culisetae]|eukprot:OMH85388.1 Nucleoside diphosphate kinase [Zancudomyces culisetae]